MWQVATKMWQMIDFERAKTSCYGWGLLFFLVVQNSVHKYKYKFHTSASKETTGSLESLERYYARVSTGVECAVYKSTLYKYLLVHMQCRLLCLLRNRV